MLKKYHFPKKTIRDIPVHGKQVLVRAEFNVPLNEAGEIASDFRIIQTVPTLEYLLSRGCSVVVVAHLGRPESKPNKSFSLQPVAKRLQELLPKYSISFQASTVDDKARQACKALAKGSLVLLENLRFDPGEEENSPEFAHALQAAAKADYFVQDGFGVVHRAHASTEAITHLLPSVAGLLVEKEVSVLERAMMHPEHPLIAVIGGAKISDKIGFIEKLIPIADTIYIGGAMANTFLKYQGFEVGKSKIEENQEKEIETILQKAKPNQIQLPSSVIVAKEIATDSQIAVRQADEVKAEDVILDIDPNSLHTLKDSLQQANSVIWNGTLGYAEIPQFAKSSSLLAKAIATSQHDLTSIVGGGDTADFVLDWLTENPKSHFTHISTGGGASLELMSGMKLPGIEALLAEN